MAATSLDLVKVDGKAYPKTKTDYVLIDNNDQTQTTLATKLTGIDTSISNKQDKLTSSSKLFDYTVGSDTTKTDVKFGGTVNFPSGGGGEMNKIDKIQLDSQDLTISSKTVNILLPTVVKITDSEVDTPATVYSKIDTATQAGTIPPYLVMEWDNDVISCPLSYTWADSHSVRIYCGVYGTMESLMHITISPTSIDTFSLTGFKNNND